MKINARHLILDLLLAAENHSLLAREAIVACQLFAISENSVRVALARLSADGLIRASGRGRYQIGPAGINLFNDVTAWRNRDQKMRTWNGHYLAIFTSHLGRSDRTALRHRERALNMLGFFPLEQGLFIRPDNIEADSQAVSARLHSLGLEAEAIMLEVANIDEGRKQQLIKGWQTERLNAQYVSLQQELTTWMNKAADLDTEQAARESFLIGHDAIRAVIYDPLLPDQFIDKAARKAFFNTVQTYDKTGREIWQKLYQDALS
ncbi:MAG: PaaX family transcriptional regulator C-terminal domain-containing protein [Moraxellaceae bacterium]|nr:PaaX family transcriptional regulator C-terminal domain-containing protein [Moraxellaceae bacterium]MDZ4297653.1 PaaX family transcriptional regulator C-terminal domain-containing protein [Moraxellaceae bacterium]MDZ4385926.1 PaaX family transcriptional regulator C-terminal domain-containing protein [Moraxellaceae bacterium]